MRESISVTTLFQIVILFILLFTAIMCLTINNANAFGVKDEIINIIEVAEGNFLDGGSLSEDVVDAISAASYRTTGVCNKNGNTGYTGYDKMGNPVSDGQKASVCIKEVNVTEGINTYLSNILGPGNFVEEDFRKGSYYQIIVFFQMDLPVVNQVYSMQVKGETKIIYEKSI